MMKILKTMLNPLRTSLLLLLFISFGHSFAQTPTPPMKLDKIIETTFDVKDYAIWKPLFEKDSLRRKENSIKTLVISSKVGQPNKMMVVGTVEDVEKAQLSMKDPAFLEKIKLRGVTNPKSDYYQVIRFNSDSKETKWVIMTHKVKDFNAWLTAFDKGKKMREDAGLIDVLIARKIGHLSMVQVVCDITDMNKAQGFLTSSVLKERMKEAGVISEALIDYYEARD